MVTLRIEVNEDLAALLDGLDRPVEDATRELLVLELYRHGRISGGKAAELLGMDRLAFVHHAADHGIPYFNYDREDWLAEIAAADRP